MDVSHQPESSAQPANVYEQFEQYPWDSDAEFQNGLNTILANNQSPELVNDLTLRAQCFYYVRKTGLVVDFEEYKSWRRQRSSGGGGPNESSDPVDSQAPQINGNRIIHPETEQTQTTSEQDPPRLSYQEVVELIQSDKPVPGIKEIPNTILEGQGTQSTRPRRKKPWEKDAVEEDPPLEVRLESANG